MSSELQPSSKNTKLSTRLITPEIFVLVVLLLFGSFLAFRIPLGAGFDEETHLLRVWEMSDFDWIPNQELSQGLNFPAFYWDLSYRRQAILQPIDPNFWVINARTPIDGLGYTQENLTTRSVYSPLLLLPQSLVMFLLGRVLHLPALTVLIAMRMIGLLIYTFLVWFAIRIAPFGKWMWAILVLTPMGIYQASTVTADTISNALGFLFISGCLYLARLQQIRWKEWITLIVLVFLLFLTKVNQSILVFLPFLILSPSRFKMKRGFLFLVFATIFLGLIEVGGWNRLAYSRLYAALPGANPAAQIQFILTHSFSVVWLLISDLGTHFLSYVKGWIADYGYGYWGPPWFVYLLYIFALVATFFIPDSSKPDRRTRIGLFVVFGLSFVATQISLYVAATPVGSLEIQFVHGRYFTVIFPLFLLGLIGIRLKTININQFWLVRISMGISVLSLLFFSAGMYLAFYMRCGTSFYQPGLCYQPVYKNWSPDAKYFQPLNSKQSLTQWIIPKCNGMTSARIWIDSTGSDPAGATEFILNDEEDDVVILDSFETNGDLPDKDWFTLTFPEELKSGGKWYTLTIQNAPSSYGEGIRVASSLRPEYIDAPLLQNGVEIDNDLIFQYGCIAGWKKLFTDLNVLIIKKLSTH